jgi:hypothetical protein
LVKALGLIGGDFIEESPSHSLIGDWVIGLSGGEGLSPIGGGGWWEFAFGIALV